jgi:hypothetical protein
MTTRSLSRLLAMIVMLTGVPTGAAAGVVLELGDILAAEPGTASISVIDPATGTKTVISQGGLLLPADKTVGVAFAPDGDVIVVHRTHGLIRVNPATGAQSVQSQGGHFRDPWAIAIDKNTGYMYVADSGYDNDRPEINEAGKIIRVDPASGAQEIIASGSPCNVSATGVACQNTTSAGSYLAHPYGVAIDYTTVPATLVVADMGSFNGTGAIIRIQPVAGGAQTLVWGPASASPPPQVAQSSPLACPMGVAVEPNGNILTTVFTFPVPPTPHVPPPAGTFYGCAPPGVFRIDLLSHTQTVVNTNAPRWEPNHAYAVGHVVIDEALEHVHEVVTAGVSQGVSPQWNGTPGGATADGSVVWQNIGLGANWFVPFGVAVEPAPTASDPSGYNIIVGDEGYRMVFRLDTDGDFVSAPLAAEVSNVTSVDVITFTPRCGFKVEPPPSNGQSFQFSAATYAATEGGLAASITVTRTGTNLAGCVDIAYATSNGTATSGADYTATSGTLTFAAGVTSMAFTVPIVNDAILESAETVNLTLTVPAGSPAVLGAPSSAVLTIQDNDGPTLRFSVASQSVAEGSSASVVVMRTGFLNIAVTVDYQVAGGTATGGGVDYTLANGTLSFAAGQASRTIVVPTVNDTLFEGPETIVLQLTNPTGSATIGTPAATTITITDNDNAGTVQFSAAGYSVAENAPSGSISLLVTRTGANLASGIAVNYAVTGGTATNGVDYTLANGTLTFATGQTSLPITVLIHNDSAPEGNETVVVTLSSATATLGANRVATLTILDDEPALTFSAAAYTATEGTASMAIPILRAGPTPAGTTVTCRTVPGGSAVADVDYRAVNTTLTFAAGSRTVTCTVPLLNDTVVDGPRTVNLELSVPPTSPGMLGAPAAAVLTLNDNDQGGTIRFGAATYSVAEGATASLTVLRAGVNLASAVTVDYAVTGGSALGGGTDYTLAAGTLTFTAGLTSRTISVPTVNDTLVEGPETVVVTLSNPTGGAALGAPAATTLTITDNDTPGTVRFSAATYSVSENVPGGVYNLLVTRTGTGLASGIAVNYAVTGGTATNGVDYTLANGTLTFAAGQTSLPIAVLIHNDADVEANKTVVVTLSSVTATLGPVLVTTLTILDDE